MSSNELLPDLHFKRSSTMIHEQGLLDPFPLRLEHGRSTYDGDLITQRTSNT